MGRIVGGLVLLQGRDPRLVDRPGWGCRSSLRRVRRHGALRQGVRGGRDQSKGATAPNRFPGSGVMTCTIRTHREDRAAHADPGNAAAAAVAGAGRQRMW